MQRYLAPFLDPNDAVLSVVLAGIDQALQQAASDYATEMGNLSILGAAGTALDRVAARFGVVRMPGETDDSLLVRLAALLQPRTTPGSLVYQLGLVGQSIDYHEPSGGSLIGWDPRWAFSYDRASIAATYTRASSATGPDGATEGTNTPTWLLQANSTYQAGVWRATAQLLNNTNFGSVTSGVPTNYTESLLAGDTMTVTTDSTYAIGDSVVQWTHGTTATSGNSTFTSPAATVSASTEYALSVYVNTSSMTAGSLVLAVVDNDAGTTTVLTSQGVSSGYVRVYGTYTTGTAATTIQLQIQFAYGATGSATFASPQVEAGNAPTEYVRNSATSGTVARGTESLTYPSSTVPMWGQGVCACAVTISPATQVQTAFLLQAQSSLAMWWDGTYWNAQIANANGNTTLQVIGALSIGTHYLLLRWHAGQGVADFWIDGVVEASASGTIYAPAAQPTLYVGTNGSGTQHINGYVGNLSLLNAWLDNNQITKWSAALRTPSYAATMLQANYDNESLQTWSGATQFGVADYFMVTLQGLSSTGIDPFYLDVSGLDSGDALQGTGSGLSGQFSTNTSILAQNLAGGVDPQPWIRGEVQ